MANDLAQPDVASYAADPLAFIRELVIPSARGPCRFADCMAPFQRERFAGLVPDLLSIARGDKPGCGRHWWEATKGASKDSDLACCLLWLLAFCPRPLAVQIGAADRDQADELRKAAKGILRLNPWLSDVLTMQALSIVNDHTDSRADIIPADVAGSHGARPDVLIINELSHVQRQEFVENLLDNASKVPHGLVIIATNAGWLDTWQHKLRETLLAFGRWRFHVFARPAPWLDDAEMGEARARNSASRFRRLWQGVWGHEDGGDAIDAAQLAACVTLTGPAEPGANLHPFVACLDLGIRRDRSALVTLGFDSATPRRIVLARCESWLPADYHGELPVALVRKAILRAHHDYRLSALVSDPWEARYLVQDVSGELPHVGIYICPLTPAWQNRMAVCLKDHLCDKRLAMYPDTGLLADFGRLSLVDKPEGYRLVAARDADGHADRAFALAMGLPVAYDLALAALAERYGPQFPERCYA